MSYTIPNITFTTEDFVHQRNLGQKMSGSHLYPSVPWSDVVLQDVPIEVTMALANQDEAIMESTYSLLDLMIGSRPGSGIASPVLDPRSRCRSQSVAMRRSNQGTPTGG